MPDASDPDGEPRIRTGTVTAGPNVARQHIHDQAAGGIPNSWREGKQNGIDAPGSTRVRLQYSPWVSIITDDGEGMELTQSRVEKILTELGKSTKDRDDDSTYGQFGVGWGQVLAKGLVICRTRNSIIVFDSRDWYTAEEIRERLPVDPFPTFDEWDEEEMGEPHPLKQVRDLDYALGGTDEFHDGMTVFIHHYPDAVPDPGSVEWENYDEEIRDRFRYVPDVADVDIEINGDPIVPDDPLAEDDLRGEIRTVETDDAYIAVCNAVIDDITVYSRGMKVCDVDGEGLKGHIITKRNLDVNLARNDIKHSDRTWRRIKEKLEGLRLDIFNETSDSRLYTNARKAMVRRMLNDAELKDRWRNRNLIPLANDNRTSLAKIQTRDEIGLAAQDDRLADKVIETGEVVLDETADEVELLQEWNDLPDEFDVEGRAEELGLTADYEMFDDDSLNTRQLRQLVFARCLAKEFRKRNLAGSNRRIMWGEHDAAVAWTDGANYIVLTDDVTKSRKREVWMADIKETLVHEMTHTNESQDSGHGHGFSNNFRKRLEHPDVQEAFTDLVEDVVEVGFDEAFRARGQNLSFYD